MKTYIAAFVCEGDSCGSPTYGNAVNKWIFELNRFEIRVVCGGCGHVQSKQYSDDLINDKILPPIPSPSGEWIHPTDDGYQEAVHYSKHEKLIEIVGLPRKTIQYSTPRRYS